MDLDILWWRLLITASVFLFSVDLLWSFLAVNLLTQTCPLLCIYNSLISSRSYLTFFLIYIFKVFPGDITESVATTHLLSQILFILLSSLFHLIWLCASPSYQSFFIKSFINSMLCLYQFLFLQFLPLFLLSVINCCIHVWPFIHLLDL